MLECRTRSGRMNGLWCQDGQADRGNIGSLVDPHDEAIASNAVRRWALRSLLVESSAGALGSRLGH